MTGYERLAEAIIIQAVEDYRDAAKRIREIENNPHPAESDDMLFSQARGTLRSVERFFRSDWFRVLTRLSGTALLDRLRKETV